MQKPSHSPVTIASVSSGRRNNFDFLRLALAVLVIFSHSFPLGAGSEQREPFRLLTHGQMTGGAIAVDLFFIMSGFLIAASAENSRTVWSFLRKRVLRIYPAFVVAALLTVVFVVPFSGAHVQGAGNFALQTMRLREFGYSGAFAQNPYPGAINGSVWSIPFEFWCYIGVALLLMASVLRRRGVVLGLFVASLVVSVLFQTHGWVFGGKLLGVVLGSPQLWARLLPLYLAGVTVYLFREHVVLRALWAMVAVVLLGIACFVPVGCTALFPLAGTYLVFYVAFAPWIRLHHVGRFGDFSYGTYLYAFPVQQLVMSRLGHTVSPWTLFAVATPITLLMAVASWYGVERHFLKAAPRKPEPEVIVDVEPLIA